MLSVHLWTLYLSSLQVPKANKKVRIAKEEGFGVWKAKI
jgi:hypothetical protein